MAKVDILISDNRNVTGTYTCGNCAQKWITKLYNH